MINEAHALDTEAERQLSKTNGGTAATIAWIGYDTPNSTGPGNFDWSRGGEVGGDGQADIAARSLADFYRGLDATSERPDAHVTALGHSYGSVVTSHALQESNSEGIDNAVFYGSPGLGDAGTVATITSGTLGLNHGDAYVIETDDDVIADAGWFGSDPSRAGDLVQLTADAGTDRTGVVREGGTDHASYPRSVSGPDGRDWLRMPGYNIAAIVSGSGLQIREEK
jgi:hypothetical protein